MSFNDMSTSLDKYLAIEKEFECDYANCDKMKALMVGLTVFNMSYDPADFYYAPLMAEEKAIYCGARRINVQGESEIRYLLSLGWRWNQNRYCWFLPL